MTGPAPIGPFAVATLPSPNTCSILGSVSSSTIGAAVTSAAALTGRRDHLLPTAPALRPSQTGYEGDGWVLLKHPETEAVERGLHELVSMLRVESET